MARYAEPQRRSGGKQSRACGGQSLDPEMNSVGAAEVRIAYRLPLRGDVVPIQLRPDPIEQEQGAARRAVASSQGRR